MKILVIDDNPIARKILVSFLSKRGSVDEVSNGFEAIAAVEQALKEQKPYCLVFLDINMPNLSGQDVLTRIREIEKIEGRHRDEMTKIVMTTSLSDKKTVYEAKRRQADGFLLKPVTPQILEAELRRLKVLCQG